ncbi:MAG: bifunctional aspartate kinase/homoserine dehydrogenase I, partial [Cyclobacteriaceae bacterium]|nr:bifunctional aspartate kinase/homoserine dehydrogenase I [Cyclobacteriaceae bacterium]
PTIQPVFDENIPIYIKNTFNPSSPGTKISRHDENNGSLIKGLSCIQKIALINLKGSGMVGIPNISNRLFKALSLEKINVIMITQASSEHSICVGIDEQSVTASKRAIENEFAFEINIRKIDPLEIETGLSIIALVGSNMRHQIGVSGKMFSTLGENGINIKAIAQGSSERNISVIIDSPNVRKALSSLHESFFLSETKRINLFVIGVGNVGGAFLEQIKNQKNYLYKKHHLDIRVIAIANTTKMLINGSGLDLNHWKKNLTSSNSTFSLDDFVGEMVQMNLRNSVFIDNTDSAQIASVYEQVLSSNISVVTPNKVACSSGYENYIQLKSVALKSKSKFLFETNVGAGLPIISTINDLVKSGDVIHKIEAVLSGSLNFIFNNYSRDIPFKEVVLRAMKEGYTEPDPRIDLSGIDVRRKILILVRECGYQFNIDDVASIPFIPKHIMEADSIDGFVENLGKSEEEFLKLLDEAEKNDTRIKYVAMFSEGKASAGIQFIHKHHPFYQLEGKDNIILLYTERYKDQPLVVKGAGAGAEVTASGIFADVMRFANR